jgi:hypothetical protein
VKPPVAATLASMFCPEGARPDPEGLRRIVTWAAEAPLRVRWSAAEVRAHYCARSPRQVLEAAELGFTSPCADLSSLVAVALAELGLRPTLVLGGIRRPLSHVKFQCGLEVELGDARWVVGFGVSSTYLYPGAFVETRRRPIVLRARPARIDPDVPFLAHFGDRGREDVARSVSGYDLERDLAWHAARQGWLRYRWARRRASSAARAHRADRILVPGRWT